MTEQDDQLRGLFMQDLPPTNDPAFTMTVMARVARRQFLFDVGVLFVITSLGGAVLWSAWPVLARHFVPLAAGLSPVIACLSLAITAVVLLEGRVTAASGSKHG